MVTLRPLGPRTGVNDVMIGAGVVRTVNEVSEASTPPGVVTEIGPEVAPKGTSARIWMSESTTKALEVPLNVTDETPVNPVPATVTSTPACPLVGKKEAITGGGEGVTVKLSRLELVPSGSVSAITPEVAPGSGDLKVRFDREGGCRAVERHGHDSVLESANLSPEIVTEVPTGPLAGRKPTTVGAAARAGDASMTPARTSVTIAVAPDDFVL
jgi:hypothetical protein